MLPADEEGLISAPNLDANCFLVMCKSHVPGGLYQCVAMGNPWQNGPFQWKKTQVVESLHWLVWFPEGDQNSTDMVGFFSWFNLKIADKMWLTWRYGWIRILTVLLPRRSRFVRHFLYLCKFAFPDLQHLCSRRRVRLPYIQCSEWAWMSNIMLIPCRLHSRNPPC